MRLDLGARLAQLRQSRLVRQNIILFAGGLVAGIGGFVYHAIAGRVLGPEVYGQVAFLIALYAVGTAPPVLSHAFMLQIGLRTLANTSAAGGGGVVQ